jgi:hypothetical protein
MFPLILQQAMAEAPSVRTQVQKEHPATPLYSIDHGNAQVLPRLKERGNRSHLFMGGASKVTCKRFLLIFVFCSPLHLRAQIIYLPIFQMGQLMLGDIQ